MMRREEGFTLIEILVVITIIAALIGLVTLVIPQGQAAQRKVVCQNNLRQIGGLLTALKVSKGSDYYRLSGAGFLLQIADQVKDEDLAVFICPGEVDTSGERPKVGSAEFVEMYRTMDLNEVEDKYSSYAGPNWKEHPPARAGRAAQKSRLIGCDKCQGGAGYHDGITVLYDTSKVEFIDMKSLQISQEDKDVGHIEVGPNAEDPRLKQMIYFPNR